MVHQIQSEQEFDDAIKSPKLTVVDYYATWCNPCKRIAPVFDRLAEANGEAQFFKVDVDQLEDLAAAQGVTGMPTFIFYKNGSKVETLIGANEASLTAAIAKHK
eukprot:EC793542.1.p1 GENE.EC793542.1~~EC793542.1.p1  ORF type:complete len:104 (+),score=46.93 EC793542.1:56-367(+)